MNDKPKTFVTKVDLGIAGKLQGDLVSQGFEISKPQYTVFSAKKKGIVCTLYESGKLMVQGKGTPEFMEFYLEPEILKSFDYSYSELKIDKAGRIGIDEAGKGDYFGPLCVAGVYASGDDILNLKKLGVKDSKSMTDATILKIGKKIQKEYPYHIIKINPFKYNELYGSFKNLNKLLAWGHATAIENLIKKTGCTNALIDQFAAEWVVESALKKKNLEVNLTQRTKGEEDLVVAAASILARQAFLEGLSELSRKFEVKLPKGANHGIIAAGRQFIQKHGKKNLGQVAKLHFKTTDQLIS